MMFVLAMRTLVNTTATKAMRNPATVPLMMLVGVTANATVRWLSP